MASIPLKTIQFPDLPDTYVVAPPIVATASGGIASFADGADDLPVADLTVSVVPKQASGTPSPSNVLPISGFTKATVKRAGKNLLAHPYATASRTVNGLTFTVNDDGTVSVSGTASATTDFALTVRTGDNFILPAGTYHVSGCPSGGASNKYQIRVGRTVNGADSQYGQDNGSGLTFTVTEAIQIGVGLRVYNGQTVSIVFEPMVRLEGDATFEPYTADTYEVSLGSAGTVYGGTLDVTTGKLTVTWGIVDMGTLAWETHSSTTTGGLTIYRYDGLDRAFGRQVYSDIYYDNINASVSGMTDYQVTGNAASARVYVVDTRYSTPAALKAGIAGHQLCYELATPVEYDLTPTEVRTLLGANNIWSDTGDTTVEYRADTKLYIDKLIAETQALILES